MLDHIIAKSKPRESLVQHTLEVIKYWKYFKSTLEDQIELDGKFWEDSFYAALFHDLGKVALNFQDKIQGRTNQWDDYIRHEFISGMLLLFLHKTRMLANPLALFAVFSHHKPLNSELFEGHELKKLKIEKSDLEMLLDWVSSQLQKEGIYFSIDNKFAENFSGFESCEVLYRNFKQFYKNKTIDLTEKDRYTYVILKAILNCSDWSGSNHGLLTQGLDYSPKYLADKIKAKLLKDGLVDIVAKFSWKDFQNKSAQKDSHVIAIAPTGSGKTEASLLWAANKKKERRIIYLLPTRVTSNAIFRRLKQYFGENEVAVVHSSAYFFRKDLDEEDNYTKGDYLIEKTFFKNINVCTIDQILTIGFNLGYWELKTFHLWNAKVIIDEIHLYAPYTLGLIISTISYLKKEFNTEFFVMTATMPQKLKLLLQKTLEIGADSVIADKELLNKARNEFHVREGLIDSILPEIKAILKSRKKVLIVVNTVDEAIRLYGLLNGIADETICYHSRFIQKDRLQKEEDILKKEKSLESFLLIATQVVEVSLDIDFDILYSENAPIDAVIQRAGRVNRKREKKGTKVIVFKEQEVTKKVIYTDVEQILEKTFQQLKMVDHQQLTEAQLVEMVDRVYDEFDVEQHDSFKLGRTVYREIQQKLHFIKDNNEISEIYTREGLDSVNVIPWEFQEMLEQEEVKPIEKAKYELSIRKKRYYSLKSKSDIFHSWFKYVDVEYNQVTGMSFVKSSSISAFE